MQDSVATTSQTTPIIAPQQIVQRTIPTLQQRVDEAITAKAAVVNLLLSSVLTIDSAGLNWLLAVHAQLETLGMHLLLRDPSPIVSDVLLATRLDSRFTVAVTEASENHGNGSGGDHAR
jgi:anti-anti-sigma factor